MAPDSPTPELREAELLSECLEVTLPGPRSPCTLDPCALTLLLSMAQGPGVNSALEAVTQDVAHLRPKTSDDSSPQKKLITQEPAWAQGSPEAQHTGGKEAWQPSPVDCLLSPILLFWPPPTAGVPPPSPSKLSSFHTEAQTTDRPFSQPPFQESGL